MNRRNLTDKAFTLKNKLIRVKKAYSTIVNCQDIVMEASNEEELFSRICAMLTKDGVYKFAWIGYPENDENRSVVPIAESGLQKGYLSSINISWGDNSHGLGPTGKAIRYRKSQVIKNISRDPKYSIWREKALKFGYNSSIAIPIIYSDQLLGVLNLYSDKAYVFDLQEVNALEKLSKTIARGIHVLKLSRDKNTVQNSYYDIMFKTVEAFGRALEKRDPYTAGHQKRVSYLAVAIGMKLGLSDRQLEGLRLGGLVHDIGKIYVPAEILSRPGKLSNAEFEIIKTHSQVGYDIINDIEFPWPIKKMILQHHERLDGSGYPNGLTSEDIIIEAKILAVSDVVEAISSHRPYRAALGMEKALEEIKAYSGLAYDPSVVDACVELFEKEKFEFPESQV